MSGIIRCTEPVAAGRILKFGNLLRRLRPFRLDVIRRQVAGYCLKYQACRLMETHFPERVAEIKPKDEWDDVFFALLRHVEAHGWFPVDWGILEDLQDAWLSDPDGDYDWEMAEYLTGLPVQTFGFTENDFEWYAGLRVLAAMVNPDCAHLIDPALIEDLDIYRIGAVTIEETLERAGTADFSDQPEPLCWLGEMVRIAAGNTGNILLDTALEPGDWWPEFFTWKDDLARVRAAWLEARPVADHLEAFKKWLEKEDEDEDEKVRLMVDVLLGEEEEGEDEDE